MIFQTTIKLKLLHEDQRISCLLFSVRTIKGDC